MVWRGEVQSLTKNEVKLLALLMEYADQVVSREECLTALWEDAAFVDDNTLTVNVTRLRKKLARWGIDDGHAPGMGIPAGHESVGEETVTRSIIPYLKECKHWIAIYTVNTAVLLIWFAVVRAWDRHPPQLFWDEILYGACLSGGCLLLFLTAHFFSWYRKMEYLRRTVQQAETMVELSHYPFDDTLFGAWTARWIERLHERYREQLQSYQSGYRRHLDFVHLWVHQMKTSLLGLSLLCQQQRPQTADERERWLQTEEAVEKLAEGLDTVLHMARLQDFALDVHIRRTDLLQQVKEVIDTRKRTMIRLGIFPRIDAEQGDWPVYTDPKWNKVILEQILSNALKYGSQADKEGQYIRFGLYREGREVVLTISDDGPGIPPQDLPRIFDPFFTGENGRRFSHATGVGLYLVKQVTERLGHHVSVTSTPGEGTCVTLRYQGEQVV